MQKHSKTFRKRARSQAMTTNHFLEKETRGFCIGSYRLSCGSALSILLLRYIRTLSQSESFAGACLCKWFAAAAHSPHTSLEGRRGLTHMRFVCLLSWERLNTCTRLFSKFIAQVFLPRLDHQENLGQDMRSRQDMHSFPTRLAARFFTV